MDPVGPWSAYASYNRLAGVQPAGASAELHHHTGASPSTASQLLPGGFLSPSPVGYEGVFSPLFHHAGAKPPSSHYAAAAAQHRVLSTKQVEADYSHREQSFFDQGSWQQNSPFGILPHESVVPTTSTKTSPYENFNAHFAAAQSLNHLNSQLAKSAATRAQSPQTTKSGTFFQVPEGTTKSFPSSNTSMQSSCIVSSPANTPVTKEYRVPQAPSRTYITTPNPQRAVKQPSTQLQNKPKIYTEITQNDRAQRNEETQSQSSPISFSMDATSRLNYANSNNATKRQQYPNYRHYSQANNEQEFQRPKSGPDYSNGPDCNVVVPRRPSPLQAHSQASPIGHASSPAYPMYNSPMNSISSPQQPTANQVTPPSPLDVSVPRPSTQPTNIAYPSVITRSLNTNEKTYPDRYERAQGNTQSCWEERQNQARKFPNQTPYNGGVQENQNYFNTSNTNQVPLQDLSSCRGDPMSLVKNLQQQQQSCQVVSPVEVKQEVKPVDKRRKSAEKSPTIEANRVPPPAHNQHQNGAYFDFDRWNLPPPPPASKIFSPQTLHQQQLMVPHPHGHHPPPTMPYFPPFHLPPPPTEFTPAVEIPPMTNYVEQNAPTSQYQEEPPAPPAPENQPKVVVPNIEEELNFLSHTTPSTTAVKVNSVKPANNGTENTASGSSFISSYLKFLQGERETSPPPLPRGTRKPWSNSTDNSEENMETNGSVQPQTVPGNAKRLSQGDPQDDPRYFPLPKERKRNSFESGSDGLSSEDDFFSNSKKNFSSAASKARRKAKSSEKKRPPRKQNRSKNASNDPVPRRQSSKRAAKEKMNFSNFVKDDDIEEPQEYQDSDSDPAWTPQAKEDGGEDIVPISKRLRKGPTKKRRNLINAAAQGAGINENDGYHSDGTSKKSKSKVKQNVPLTLEDNIAASLPNNNPMIVDDQSLKPGEFVVIKSEMNQEWPAIWRVDGKSLLQKFEPFEQRGITLYKNISTYTSFTPESKKQYLPVPVRYKFQNQTEMIVELVREDIGFIDYDYQQKCMKDCEGFQENFEVYIQTLISQALDSNFLTEIFQEKDEYFLSNVKTIDDITDNKKKKLLALLRWPPAVQAAVCTWPCFNVIREVSPMDVQMKSCAACDRSGISVRVLMYGQPYNSTTLEGCQPDPKAMNEKNFLMCTMCAGRVELSNKVTHQKYLMYLQCAKRVAEKRTGDPSKDTTCILNELLADEVWLNQLFLEVRTSWAEIDCIQYSMHSERNSVYTQ